MFHVPLVTIDCWVGFLNRTYWYTFIPGISCLWVPSTNFLCNTAVALFKSIIYPSENKWQAFPYYIRWICCLMSQDSEYFTGVKRSRYLRRTEVAMSFSISFRISPVVYLTVFLDIFIGSSRFQQLWIFLTLPSLTDRPWQARNRTANSVCNFLEDWHCFNFG